MSVLKEESSGPEVVKLQERLKERGFNPGLIDGVFGPATKAAVIAFEKSEGLLANGIAGPRTQGALGLVADTSLPAAIPGVTVTIVSKMFPHTPVDNIRTNLPFVLNGLVEKALVDKPMVLMSLATIRAETEGFEPISEGKSKFNTSPGAIPLTCTTIVGTWQQFPLMTCESYVMMAADSSFSVSTIRFRLLKRLS